MRVLIVEDGEEYSSTLSRFLAGFTLVRAGDGHEALDRLAAEHYDVVFLDMRFDRVPASRLIGDMAAAEDRCNGDRERATRFLEDNQGAYVLAAVRAAGHVIPVVFSYDFDHEPRRWKNLEQRFAPLGYLNSNAGPDQIRAALEEAARRRLGNPGAPEHQG
ncbi:MAG TPA: hypothetical protein QGF58_01240 [Myxococcota bacterium]|nr:hypothetical protein [Myxococcota bacterium]